MDGVPPLCYNSAMQERIVPTLRCILEAASLLREDATLLAAVSGGADSVAMIHAAAALRQEEGFRLAAVHVEHGLRGAGSQEDANFVTALCGELGVPLRVYHARLSGGMDGPGTEDRARRARRAFFQTSMGDLQADALLLAHHRDDQAETILMRLLRGAGTAGLGGMRATTPFGGGVLLRPFLSIPREELLSALQRNGLTYREDPSNSEPCCLRNQLRLQAMPLLTACQPKASQHMAQTAMQLQWDEDCLGAMAAENLRAAQITWPGACALRCDLLKPLPQAILLRVLRMWVHEACNSILPRLAGGSAPGGAGYQTAALPSERALSLTDSLRLYHLVLERGRMNLPQGLLAARTGSFLHLMRQDGSPLEPFQDMTPLGVLPRSGEYCLGPHIFQLKFFGGQPFSAGLGCTALPLSPALLSHNPVLRYPQPGDRFHPFGASGSKTLRRYFTDRKVDRPFRAAWPVVAMGSDVLWVAGVGAGEASRFPNNAQNLWALQSPANLPYP